MVAPLIDLPPARAFVGSGSCAQVFAFGTGRVLKSYTQRAVRDNAFQKQRQLHSVGLAPQAGQLLRVRSRYSHIEYAYVSERARAPRYSPRLGIELEKLEERLREVGYIWHGS